jgi:DNA replication protein DnaC
MATQIRKDLTHLCRELKAPSLLASFERLAKRGRDETWSYEEFLAACLEREVASRQSHGGENRIKAAHFPQTKTLEDFDFSYQRSSERSRRALGHARFIEAKDNVIFLVRREREKSHLAIALGLRACQAGHRSRSRPRRPGSIA